MATIGLILIALTAILFAVAGILYTQNKHISIEDFITARNSMKLNAAVPTLVASTMGAWILFSPAETSVRGGITALIGYGLGSAAALFVFIWLGVRLRRLMPSGNTLTEYVYHRFGQGMHLLVLAIAVFYMAVYLTAELTGIAVAARMVFGTSLWLPAAIVGFGTLAYTASGGLQASVFTDRIQGVLILPLLIIAIVASLFHLGEMGTVFANASTKMPHLFDPGFTPGIETGITLILAIVAANLFHQGFWQRVYASDSEATVKRSFLIAGLLVIPIVLMAGSFGFFAVGTGVAEEPSVSLFKFLLDVTPMWILMTIMILAVTLVMSTMDTLLNGVVSLFTVDIVRARPQLGQDKILSAAKWFTVVLAVLAILIATQGFSVLYLFLVADLVCAAAVFPTFFGLYSSQFSGRSALLACIIGIVAGAAYFPDPAFRGGLLLSPLFGLSNLLASFVVALFVPAVLSVLLALFDKKYDFNLLRTQGVTLKN